MIALIAHLDHEIAPKLPLNIQVPTDRIRIHRPRIVKGDALAVEGGEPEVRTGGLLQAGGKWVGQRGIRREVSVICGHKRSSRAEAALVDAYNLDGENERAEAAA